MNYTIADFLIRIKNAYMAYKMDVVLPYSKVNLALGTILVEEGYIKSIEEKKDGMKKNLAAKLKYDNRQPAMTDVKIVSTPALHIHVKKHLIPKSYGVHGVTIVSTNEGIMTDKKARKKGVGGKVLCQVF